jgi:hypothetical protein
LGGHLLFLEKLYKNLTMKNLGKWFFGFGVFLFVCGILGFVSNPVAAKTALITGSFFGGLNLLIGWGLLRGYVALRYFAGAITVLLVGAFSWRSTAGWVQVLNGEPKHFAAGLITVMLIASIFTLIKLLRHWRLS